MSILDMVNEKLSSFFNGEQIKKIKEFSEEYKKKQEDLIEDLEKVKSDYIDKTTLGDKISVDLRRMNNDDISKIAKTILEDDYEAKRAKINSDYSQAVNNANNDLTDTRKKAEQIIAKAEEDRKNATAKINDKGLKNNISRSSAVELSKQQAVQDSKNSQTQAEQSVLKAEEQLEKKVANAVKNKEQEEEKTQKEYEANLIAKENELKNLRDTTSEYEKEYIDQREATNYSNELVNLVTEFTLSLPEQLRQDFLSNNKQLKSLLTEDEIKYVQKMIS